MILLAKCAHLPVPLFSHSTGFTAGSIKTLLGDLLNEVG